jgi:hypothetical protein
MNKHLIEATKLALEALYMANTREWPENKIGAAINALSATIEQAEKQEPVARLGLEPSDMPDGDDPMYDHDFFIKGMVWADAMLCKKNAIPPAAQWVGLTEKDFSAINQSCLTKLQAATSAESILKEKNHG